jgi:hypothetical protein
MSKQAVMAVLERARADGHFYQLLQADPDTALAGYDLTRDEHLALLERDRTALLALGVPPEWADWWAIQH